MIKLSLLKINRIIKKLKVFVQLLAENSFLVFLTLFLASLFVGLIIFYHYVFLPEKMDVVIEEEELLNLNLEKQARVLEEWQNRNDNFYKADSKERIDPFHRVD